MTYVIILAVVAGFVAVTIAALKMWERSSRKAAQAEVLKDLAQQEAADVIKTTDIINQPRSVDDTIDRLRKSDF